MSTDYTHFSNLAFTNLFARGPDGSEQLIINSSGVFVGVLAFSGTLTVASLSASGTVTGSNLSGTNTGNVTIGTANGLSIAGQALSMNAAGSGTIGVVNLGSQGFTGTKSFLGLVGVGGTSNNVAVLNSGSANPLGQSRQYGYLASLVATSAATNSATSLIGYAQAVTTTAAAFTAPVRAGFYSFNSTKGAGSTITRDISFFSEVPTQGTNNAILADNLAFSGSYAINIASTNASVLAGSLTASNISGTNTGDNVNASSSTAGIVSTGVQSFAGAKTFKTALAGSNVVSASSSASGVVSTGAQSFAGVKTFATQAIIKGTASNDSPAAGFVGEIISTSGNGNVGTSGQFFDVLSISLTPGDWDVTGMVEYVRAGATYTSTIIAAGISSTTGNSATGLTNQTYVERSAVIPTTFTNDSLNTPTVPVKVASTTTYYLKGYTDVYTIGQPTYTASIIARRRR